MLGVSLAVILVFLTTIGLIAYAVSKVIKKIMETDPAVPREGMKFCSGCGEKFDVNLATCPGCGLEQSYFGTPPPTEQGRIWLRTVAAVQIFGGASGIFATTGYETSNQFSTMLTVIFLVLYAYCIVAGYWLWKGYAKGYVASAFLQIAQIPVIGTPILSYEFVSGASLRLVAGLSNGINFHMGSYWSCNFLGGMTLYLGANVLPLFAYYALLKFSPVMLPEVPFIAKRIKGAPEAKVAAVHPAKGEQNAPVD